MKLNVFKSRINQENEVKITLVSMGPGAIQLNLIPYRAHSDASDRVRASTPALAQALCTTKPEPESA